MTAEKTTYVTAEGFKRLKQELDELKNVKRKKIAERIREAKDLGDLSENAEYQEAKDEQGFIERRIVELKNLLHQVEVIKKTKKGGAIQVGSKIKVKNEKLGKEFIYIIVGSSEANPSEGKISNISPMGQAFIGSKEGETVIVQVPAGAMEFVIISVG